MNIFTSQSVCEQLDEKLKNSLEITVLPVVGSTNTELKSIAEQGGKNGIVLIALEQTKGRGRLGRSFYSPKDTGLYMSILLRPEMSASDALHITTCAAVAASEAIDKIANVHTAIKWVNDIYLNGKKIVGILTESSIDFKSGGLSYAVLGIGINLTTKDFPEDLKEIATSVTDERVDLRAEVAAEFLNRFYSYFDEIESLSYLSEYRRRSMLNGQEIEFIQGDATFSGTVIGIDDDVRLLVRLENGEERAFSSGEVQLKKGGIIK